MNLKEHALNVRRNIVKLTCEAKSGHPGGSLSATDIVTYLYFKELGITEENADSFERNRFVLSKGHAAPCLYAVLSEIGLYSEEEIMSLRKIGSPFQGHPNMSLRGIDMSTGSLGQGFSCAVGMAISNKLHNNEYRVYALLGDGECQEGLVWEAAMAASHYNLDNLCVIVDANHLQIDGHVEEVMNPYPLDEKFKSFGFEVICINGHDFDEIEKAFAFAKTVKGKPVAIIAETVKGKGVSFMEDKAGWHGVAPSVEQRDEALKELGE